MSDIETSGLGFGRPAPQDEFRSESVDEPLPPAAREGLPSSYRMRADAHYVDTLASRRERVEARRPAPATPPAFTGTRGPEPPPAATRARRSDRVLARVGEEIAAITSAAALLGTDTSALARQTGQELIRAQAWRAAWLLKASMLLDGRHAGERRPVPLVTLVEQLRQGLAPECRLAGVTLHVHAPDVTALIDTQLVTTGVTGAVMATLGLVAGCQGASLRVTFDVAGGELRAVDVSQDLVVPASTVIERVFDPAWSERPGGWTALMGALAAREAARPGGGQAELTAEQGGSRLRIGFLAP